MPLNEKITAYSVALLKNNLVPYTRVLRMTTETGHRVFIGYEPEPRPNWLEITATYTNVFVQDEEFDRAYHLLQTESPVYFTAITLLGITAYNLSTDQELPGEGPGDEDALVTLAARMREG